MSPPRSKGHRPGEKRSTGEDMVDAAEHVHRADQYQHLPVRRRPFDHINGSLIRAKFDRLHMLPASDDRLQQGGPTVIQE